MAVLDNLNKNLQDFQLWSKIKNEQQLTLANIQAIIPMRWIYFRDNWDFIYPDLQNKAENYYDPNLLRDKILDFTDFLNNQRNVKQIDNPLASDDIYYKYYVIFDNMLIEDLQLTNEEKTIINNEILRVSIFSKKDFLNIRQSIIDSRSELFDRMGLSDPTYDEVYNRTALPQEVDATVPGVADTQNFNNIIKELDYILCNNYSYNNSLVDPFALARQNANNPDVNIGQYSSGTLVRMPYNEDLSFLAKLYLGDADKWIDIAIANGLKPPYIDEIGTNLYLIANGDSNKISISGVSSGGDLNIDKLYINQIVMIQSDTLTQPEQRYINNIEKIPVSDEIVLTLSGDNDLDKYTKADNSYIKVFKSNTINSNFYILIPNNNNQPAAKGDTPWFLQNKGLDERNALVDLKIDDNGDIIFTNSGDLQLSYGIENAMQALKIKLTTEKGSLKRHSDFGLVSVIGNKNMDIPTLKSTLVQDIQRSILEDARFDRIDSIDVRYNQTVFYIKISVRLAGASESLPITFSVNLD